MKVLKIYLLLVLFMVFYVSCRTDKNNQLRNNGIEAPYLTKEVIAAYIASLAAIIVGGIGFYQFQISRKDQRQNFIISREDQTDGEVNRNLWEALKWFESGTQKRSIGIAVIEAYWNDERRKDIKRAWIPLLINQAFHILKASDGKDKVTEQINLERIINLLQSIPLTNDQKSDIRAALSEVNYIDNDNKLVEKSDKGIFIKRGQRDKWIEIFSK